MAVTLAPPRTRAFLVPDPAIWAAAGLNPLDAGGLEPVWGPESADRVVLPARLPSSLAESVAEALLRSADPGVRDLLPEAPLGGLPTDDVLAQARRDQQPRPEPADQADGHDHGDMMAVTGEPSDDGLVMEDAAAVIGPLSAALPTGLVLELTLDGDVACGAEIRSLVDGPVSGSALPLARAAVEWAVARAPGAPPLDHAVVARHLAATEIERALSHSMWLARFAYLLGWLDLADRLWRGATPLIAAHGEAGAASEALLSPQRLRTLEVALADSLESSRIRSRARGVATVSASQCSDAGIGGPVARAAGAGEDLRSADRAYRELGHEPLARAEGDAAARSELRAEEALASLQLARAAIEAGELPADLGPVEGPRGPLVAAAAGPTGTRVPVDPAGREITRLAAGASDGLELARALVAVASFDLDPWTVAG